MHGRSKPGCALFRGRDESLGSCRKHALGTAPRACFGTQKCFWFLTVDVHPCASSRIRVATMTTMRRPAWRLRRRRRRRVGRRLGSRGRVGKLFRSTSLQPPSPALSSASESPVSKPVSSHQRPFPPRMQSVPQPVPSHLGF